MKRKVVSVILCGTMVLGMVTGCGSIKDTFDASCQREKVSTVI